MLFGKRENSIFFYFSEKYRILEKHLILNHYPDIVPPLGGHKGRPTTNEPLTFLIQSKTINGRGGPCGRPLGIVTGCFGGVVRDVLLNEIPLVFRKDIYASASLLGGLLYFLLSGWEMFAPLATSLAILAVVLLRLAVVRFGWKLPDLNRSNVS